MNPISSTVASQAQLNLETLEPANTQPKLIDTNLAAAELTQLEQAPATNTQANPTPVQSNSFSILKNRVADLSQFFQSADTGATSSTPSTGVTGGTGLDGFNSQIGSLSGQLQSAMSQLQGLDPNDPDYLQKSTQLMMQIQQLQNQIQELVSMESNELSSQHQDAMAVINNMK